MRKFLTKDFIAIYLSRMLCRIFYLLPVNPNRIFLSSYEGKEFACNPKYIYMALQEEDDIKELQYIYEYNNNEIPKELNRLNTKTVSHNSLQYFLMLCTSKIIVTNSGITAKVPIRKSQILINTWHAGGAYKKSGKDIDAAMNGSGALYIDIAAKQTSFFLSSSKAFSKIMTSGLGITKEKFVCSGMPRNDILFADISDAYVSQIYNKLGIDVNKKIILYAPTYRGNVGNIENDLSEELDVGLLLESLSDKFGGEWVFLYRGHYFTNTNRKLIKGINVSDYPDMQELLVVAHVLITDYSSSVWDFSFTDKPGFLFVPDLETYQRNRNFYTPIEKWPYKIAKTNEELQKNIESYSDMEQKRLNRLHHSELENFETGTATKQVVDLIKQIIVKGKESVI